MTDSNNAIQHNGNTSRQASFVNILPSPQQIMNTPVLSYSASAPPPIEAAHSNKEGSPANSGKRKRGRPKGAKNKRNRPDSGEDAINTERRQGKNFNEHEATVLSKAWVHQSIMGPNQPDQTMWESIADYCRIRHVDRTPGGLRVKFGTLSQEVKRYIESKKKAYANTDSKGKTKEDLDKLTMLFYRKRDDKGDDLGPPFKYFGALEVLETWPKFKGELTEKVNEEREKCEGIHTLTSTERQTDQNSGKLLNVGQTRTDNELSVGQTRTDNKIMQDAPDSSKIIDVGNEQPRSNASEGQPKVTKAVRCDEQNERENTKFIVQMKDIAKAIERASEAIESFARCKTSSTKNDRDFQILSMLPFGDPRRKSVLNDIMARRQLEDVEEKRRGDGWTGTRNFESVMK